jgi:ribokinase
VCQRYDVVVVGGVFREIGAAPTQPRLDIRGSGLTGSVASARLGARTALIASVGAEDADIARQVLAGAGVDTRWLQATPGASGTFLFPPKADQAHPWPMFRPAESPPRTQLDGGLPQANTYLLFGLPDLDPVAEGWMNGAAAESTVLWDRQGWLSRARDWRVALDVPAGRRIYLANQDEAMADFHVEDAEDLQRRLPPDGFDVAVVKRGSEGCSYWTSAGGDVVGALVPGFPVDAESTIGSGDVFAGALAAQLAQGAGLEPALTTANAMAAAFLIERRDLSSVDLLRTANSFVGQRATER